MQQIADQYLVSRWQRNPVRLVFCAGVASSNLILRVHHRTTTTTTAQMQIADQYLVSRWQRNP
eukprot:1753125-Amphidinium_carterae.1